MTNADLAVFLLLYVTCSITALCVVALIYMVWMHYFGEENFSRNERIEDDVEYVEDVQEDGTIVIEEEEDDIIIEEF